MPTARTGSAGVVRRYGNQIPAVPDNTSRTCPAGGHISKDNRRSQAQFACVACGYQNHADVVGAINVLEAVYDLRDLGDPALKCPEKYSLTSCQLRFFGSFPPWLTLRSLERKQLLSAGTPLVSLWRVGAVRPLGEARIRRSASGASLTAVGIPVFRLGRMSSST